MIWDDEGTFIPIRGKRSLLLTLFLLLSLMGRLVGEMESNMFANSRERQCSFDEKRSLWVCENRDLAKPSRDGFRGFPLPPASASPIPTFPSPVPTPVIDQEECSTVCIAMIILIVIVVLCTCGFVYWLNKRRKKKADYTAPEDTDEVMKQEQMAAESGVTGQEMDDIQDEGGQIDERPTDEGPLTDEDDKTVEADLLKDGSATVTQMTSHRSGGGGGMSGAGSDTLPATERGGGESDFE